MKKILFQGDSITDVYRSREDDTLLGMGYPTLVAASLGMDRPGEFEYINRGISGDRSVDILGRVKRDIINLKPDYMSILVGVNDVWHKYLTANEVDGEYYEIYYNMIIDQVKASLPEVRIMIMEPFLLMGSETERIWEDFRGPVEKNAAAARRVAEKHNLLFLPLMEKFDAAAKNTSPSLWLFDGVHPTAMGHELIKREWLKAFEQLEKM